MAKTRNKVYKKIEDIGNPIVIGPMDEHFTQGYVAVEYLDADDNILPNGTVTAGQVTVQASENEVAYGDIPNGVIDCTDPNYNRPDFSGFATYIKAEETVGIVGAIKYRLVVNRGC